MGGRSSMLLGGGWGKGRQAMVRQIEVEVCIMAVHVDGLAVVLTGRMLCAGELAKGPALHWPQHHNPQLIPIDNDFAHGCCCMQVPNAGLNTMPMACACGRCAAGGQ